MCDNTSSIRSHVRAADMILAQAEQHGLRLPFISKATLNELTFQFRALDEITEWAIWAEAVIEPTTDVDGSQYVAKGVLFDQPVVLAAFVPTACRCKHPKADHTVFGSGCSAYIGRGQSCRCAGFRPAIAAVSA